MLLKKDKECITIEKNGLWENRNGVESRIAGNRTDVLSKDARVVYHRSHARIFRQYSDERAYIAKVATSLGMSDGAVGVVISLANLGAAFQLFALFFVGKYPMRRRAILFHTINQAFFALVWLTPVVRFSSGAKVMLFVMFLMGGHILIGFGGRRECDPNPLADC